MIRIVGSSTFNYPLFEEKVGGQMIDLLWFLFAVFKFAYNEWKQYRNRRPQRKRGRRK